MRSFMRHGTKVKVFPGFFIQLALLLLVLPIEWVLAVLSAGFIHELGHIFALRLFRIPIHSIAVKNSGTYIETGYMGTKQEILCALAGPAGGLCMLLVGSWVPRIAFCCALHSLYNLLPIYPSDGGRALLKCVCSVFPELVARHLYLIVKWVTVFSIAITGLFLFLVPGIGLLPIPVGIYLVFRAATLDASLLDKFYRCDKLRTLK